MDPKFEFGTYAVRVGTQFFVKHGLAMVEFPLDLRGAIYLTWAGGVAHNISLEEFGEHERQDFVSQFHTWMQTY